MQTAKIICYDDNPDYGGHQVMACLAVEALARSAFWKPVFFCRPENERLNERLTAIRKQTGNLEIRPSPFITRKLQGLRNRFSRPAIHRLGSLFEKEKPDLILCIQGEIEDGSLALCAAEKTPVPCVSYIPVPHRMAFMGAKFGAARDGLNSWLFKKPDGWITISESMQRLLEDRGAVAQIQVVHNGIDISRFVPHDRTSARAALGIPQDKTVLGTIGRIEFNQKQQDFLVRTFSGAWKNNPAMHLVIAGDGPDRKRLSTLIDRLGCRNQITLLPWQADSAAFYSALNLLVIPSRFEGVPLVMLESIACGTPVIGSARDGMKDILPVSWTFEAGNAEAMQDVLEFVSVRWQDEMPALQSKVRAEYTVGKFQQNFEAALRHFL